jgi:hypothetical protein
MARKKTTKMVVINTWYGQEGEQLNIPYKHDSSTIDHQDQNCDSSCDSTDGTDFPEVQSDILNISCPYCYNCSYLTGISDNDYSFTINVDSTPPPPPPPPRQYFQNWSPFQFVDTTTVDSFQNEPSGLLMDQGVFSPHIPIPSHMYHPISTPPSTPVFSLEKRRENTNMLLPNLNDDDDDFTTPPTKTSSELYVQNCNENTIKRMHQKEKKNTKRNLSKMFVKEDLHVSKRSAKRPTRYIETVS